MIGHISVKDQVDADFHRALFRASLQRWKDRLKRGAVRAHLLSFDEAKAALVRWSQAHRGIRAVEVSKISGSVGRFEDFDASFLPLKTSMEERWCRVDRAYHQGVDLPAVCLYKLGDAYYVRDGNHRVSVARYHGVAMIDAEVTEIRGLRAPDVPRELGATQRADRKILAPEASPLQGLRRRLRRCPARSRTRPAM